MERFGTSYSLSFLFGCTKLIDSNNNLLPFDESEYIIKKNYLWYPFGNPWNKIDIDRYRIIK
jgi:hypothetical protein